MPETRHPALTARPPKGDLPPTVWRISKDADGRAVDNASLWTTRGPIDAERDSGVSVTDSGP
ncbi:hypothetical protein GCM10010168_91020 [Actinoplanes ianthinogenes]|uniref:Uncharacterized protein n=1 Tax=Actinoplanes ianthinogenes TaxID=122358 RepID=A0ABM7LSZ1_9ACTN|nr:hypothetical protein Aiant_30340 [Actinoplanes ianthinogenes]GGR57903.1 hypothetical protein GCM10010168_91020 [Actinoplanes ianthinogenes]